MKVYLIAISQKIHTYFSHDFQKYILCPLTKAEIVRSKYDVERKGKEIILNNCYGHQSNNPMHVAFFKALRIELSIK